jgi:EAL domain-containing protein (putative c-di-GMP-specific phosphodiesterase class I)
LFCSVNVSARQIFRPEFFDDVAAIMRRDKPARLSLKLELTESVIMQNPEATARTLAQLKEAGAGLALDDFGTGFSSLTLVQNLPLDVVKIDRSFVRDVVSDPRDAAIVRSVIGLAKDVGLTVVAEGVETTAQAEHLMAMGCHDAQGYLYAKAMPFDDLVAMIERQQSAEVLAMPTGASRLRLAS